ncbi:magnesium-dependent phosphatase 1-like [Clytia hemisphaerica]|uniref:magnesium-dependent phosphatase 1-like n=1 Tax=Clytia hemisphaerica TaxID=252671 RepID=UPI0034D50DA6
MKKRHSSNEKTETTKDTGIYSLKLALQQDKSDLMPKLFVFDLDYTLWPFWCDTHVTPPFKKLEGSGNIVDKRNKHVKLYSDTKEILETLKQEGYLIAAASRTETPVIAEELLDLFDIDRFFDFKEIFPGQKLNHFSNIKRNSGVDYEKMIFFDDEQRNINDVSGLGVTCCHVDNGISFSEVLKGLD